MMRLYQQARVLLAREWLVYRERLPSLMINFFIVTPFSFSGVQGYIKPLMYFGYPLGRKAAMVFAGSMLMYFIHRTFSFATAFFFDIHRQQQVQVQAQQVPLWLIYAVRIGFSVVWSWLLMAPLFPIAKLVLRSYMYTQDTSWPLVFVMMLFVSIMMNCYAFMCISGVNSMYGISKIRVRLNEVLMWLGGFNAPWLTMYKSGVLWGVLGLCNPFTYGTEALRQAMIPGSDILPFYITVPALFAWSGLFFIIGYWLLKRQVWSGTYEKKNEMRLEGDSL